MARMWHDAGHPRRRPAHGSGGGSSAVHSAAEIEAGSDAWSTSGPRREALWMQTSGATLLATKRHSLIRALMAVSDGRCAHGLLYLAAVRRRQTRAGHWVAEQAHQDLPTVLIVPSLVPGQSGHGSQLKAAPRVSRVSASPLVGRSVTRPFAFGGSPRAFRAWPLAWPSPSGSLGWQRLRRSRASPEDRFCEAVRNDLRVPLTLEGPARTMRGIVPARPL